MNRASKPLAVCVDCQIPAPHLRPDIGDMDNGNVWEVKKYTATQGWLGQLTMYIKNIEAVGGSAQRGPNIIKGRILDPVPEFQGCVVEFMPGRIQLGLVTWMRLPSDTPPTDVVPGWESIGSVIAEILAALGAGALLRSLPGFPRAPIPVVP